jgi:hypothetical protein
LPEDCEEWEDKIAELSNLITEKNINIKELDSGKKNQLF